MSISDKNRGRDNAQFQQFWCGTIFVFALSLLPVQLFIFLIYYIGPLFLLYPKLCNETELNSSCFQYYKKKKRKRKRDKVKNQASDYLFWVGGGTATYFISLFVFIILFNLWNAYIALYKVYLCIIYMLFDFNFYAVKKLLKVAWASVSLSRKEFSWLSVFCTDYINGVYDIFV